MVWLALINLRYFSREMHTHGYINEIVCFFAKWNLFFHFLRSLYYLTKCHQKNSRIIRVILVFFWKFSTVFPRVSNRSSNETIFLCKIEISFRLWFFFCKNQLTASFEIWWKTETRMLSAAAVKIIFFAVRALTAFVCSKWEGNWMKMLLFFIWRALLALIKRRRRRKKLRLKIEQSKIFHKLFIFLLHWWSVRGGKSEQMFEQMTRLLREMREMQTESRNVMSVGWQVFEECQKGFLTLKLVWSFKWDNFNCKFGGSQLNRTIFFDIFNYALECSGWGEKSTKKVSSFEYPRKASNGYETFKWAFTPTLPHRLIFTHFPMRTFFSFLTNVWTFSQKFLFTKIRAADGISRDLSNQLLRWRNCASSWASPGLASSTHVL